MEKGNAAIVIIPTYNERENICDLIKEVFAFAPDAAVLVVDDSSPDGTADAVKELQKKFPRVRLLVRPRKEGLGLAYLDAFARVLAEGNARTIVMMDADFSHDPRYLPDLLRRANTCDMAIGSRYVHGGGIQGWELWRRVLSWAGNLYFRLITGIPVRAGTGGFNAVAAAALARIDLAGLKDFSGYAFIMALKYRLWKSGARLCEMPVLFINRKRGDSKISNHVIREGLLTPWKLLRR